ncbi:MAG: chemotaxis protein CheW [Chloroflexota bacterium]
MRFAGGAHGAQLVALELGGEVYGIEISHIQEILRIQLTRSLPDASPYIDGITNVRGNVLPVLDLRKRLGMAVSPHTHQSRLVVTDVGVQTVALVVDGVTEILTVPTDDIDQPEGIMAQTDDGLVIGVARVDGRMVIVLDPLAILPAPAARPASEFAGVR